MHRNLIALSACLILATLTGIAEAKTMGMTAQQETFVSGGVGMREREALQMQRAHFNLRVLTAAQGSGAYLADADIQITDAAGHTVLATQIDGPWLYVNLLRGEYRVRVEYQGQVKQQRTRIRAGDHRELDFYFAEAVERLPEGAID